MNKMINSAIHILCYLFVVSTVFNIIDYIGLPTLFENNLMSYVLFFCIAIITSTLVAPRLYMLIQYLEEKHQNQLPPVK